MPADRSGLRIPGFLAHGFDVCAVHFAFGRTVWTPDASGHPDYADNPWVTGRLGTVRFYASVPLIAPSGAPLGTLCVFDSEVRELADAQTGLLEDAAGVIIALLERRRQARVNAHLAAETAEQRELLALTLGELEARQEFTDAVLETIDVGVVAADAAGRLTLFNQAREWIWADATPGGGTTVRVSLPGQPG